MPTPQNDPPIWPYTLEYLSTQTCVIPPCPTQSFPGIWEVPMVDYIDMNSTLCNEVDNCAFPENKAEALELLMSNFDRHYRSNRAPFPIHLRPRWFYEAHYTVEAIQEFLDLLENMGDVYMVTMSQAIKWIQMPTRLMDIKNFGPWKCDDPVEGAPICNRATRCGYYNITIEPNSEDHPGERWISTCAETCPLTYPYTGNPEGL